MSLIQDRIVITKPKRVVVGTDRNTDEVKRMIEVEEIVAEWWVPEGADLDIPAWIEHGLRTQGWNLTRTKASHTVTDLDSPVVGVRWADVAEQMVSALRQGEVTQALDVYALAEMQQEMFDEHVHRFGADPNPATKCLQEGCPLVYADRPTEPPAIQQRPLPEWDWDDDQTGED